MLHYPQKVIHYRCPKEDKEMKRYQVYIYTGSIAKLRFETNSIDEACDKAYEIEKTSKEDFEGTSMYDTQEKKWFGVHKRGSAYILSK